MIQAGQKLSFKSKLENWAEGMDYCAIAVPKEITTQLGTKQAVLVMAVVNGSEPFQVSLFPVGQGRHYIRVRSKVRKAAQIFEGDQVKVQITVLDRNKVVLPEDFVRALKLENAFDSFQRLSPGKKNYAIRRINDVLKPETRKKRINEAIELALQDEKKKDRMKERVNLKNKRTKKRSV